MGNPFNSLTTAEEERLAVMLEEMGEALQAIGKILRHGYEKTPPDGLPTNRERLELELGDVMFGIDLLINAKDIDQRKLFDRTFAKRTTARQWLHHQPEEVL